MVATLHIPLSIVANYSVPLISHESSETVFSGDISAEPVRADREPGRSSATVGNRNQAPKTVIRVPRRVVHRNGPRNPHDIVF